MEVVITPLRQEKLSLDDVDIIVGSSISDEEFARRLQDEENTRRIINPLKNFECILCLENSEPIDGVQLHCGHPVCLSCMKDYAQMAIEKTDLMTCPTCNEPCTSRDIESVLDNNWADRYVLIETIKLRQDTSLYHCPTPDCPNSVVLDADLVKFDCNHCKQAYCTKCKVPYHHKLTCKKFQEKLELTQDVPLPSVGIIPEMEKMLKAGKLKQCQCGNYIEKNGGCWYIKCPMCHLGFCWKCNKILGDGSRNCKHTEGHMANPKQWNSSSDIKVQRIQRGIRDAYHMGVDGQATSTPRRCSIM